MQFKSLHKFRFRNRGHLINNYTFIAVVTLMSQIESGVREGVPIETLLEARISCGVCLH